MSVSLQDHGALPSGPAEPRAWRDAGVALLVGLAIVILGTAAGFGATVVVDRWTGLNEARAFAAGESLALLTARVSISLLAFQCVTIALVLFASSRLQRGSDPLIPFTMPRGGPRTLLLAMACLVVLAALYGTLVYSFSRDAFAHDIGPFAEMMKSRTWWLVFLAAGVGAPLAEEFLFRGLIYGAVRRTPVGIVGAAVFTAVTWASLHANYSLYGLVAISLIGLYLAFLREATGTLVTSIVCHGAYNSLIVLLLVFAPDGFLSAG